MTYQITIRAINANREADFIQSLKEAFESTGASVELDTPSMAVKSFDPIIVTILVTTVVNKLSDHALGRYILDPAFNWFETAIKVEWEKILKKTPLRGLKIAVVIEGASLEITSERLKDAKWIENYLRISSEILELFNQEVLLKDVTNITVKCADPDNVEILAQGDGQKYHIDLPTKKVREIT